jgi:hypothetical protein
MECELVCEAAGLYVSSEHELETDGEGWAVCWACPLLFSDDAARYLIPLCGTHTADFLWLERGKVGLQGIATIVGSVSPRAFRFAHIEGLNQQRGQLAQRRDQLQQLVQGAQQALEEAQGRQQRVQQARRAAALRDGALLDG